MSSNMKNTIPIPSDILIMIFEQLHITGSLRPMRLVDTRFEDLIAPFVYQEVELTEKIVEHYRQRQSSSQKDTTMQRLMSLNTRHVIIRRPLHWKTVQYILTRLEKLRSLQWVYWPTRRKFGERVDHDSVFNSSRFEEIRRDWPDLRYTVDSLRSRDIQGSFVEDASTKIVACKLIEWNHLRYIRFVKDETSPLFLNSSLETLHITGLYRRATISEGEIEEGERMAPIKELSLAHFDWAFSVHTATTFWNWSNLVRLELKEVPIVPFLQTVAPEYLLQLREFSTDGFVNHRAQREEATNLIATLVLAVRSLDKLILTCFAGYDNIVSAVTKHEKLRTLQLCVYHTTRSRFPPQGIQRRQLDEHQLETISQACPHLTTLEISFMPVLKTLPTMRDGLESPGERSVLTGFRNLRRLTAHACIYKWKPSSPMTSNEAINIWLECMVSAKKGAPFETAKVEFNIFEEFPDMSYVCSASPKAEYTG